MDIEDVQKAAIESLNDITAHVIESSVLSSLSLSEPQLSTDLRALAKTLEVPTSVKDRSKVGLP